ncbi:hypothetical protein [Microseira wollei]|uniref:Uncharacterized protein n=1 Tax=Microseira wollei NIES-4236 TaxID=2530354 RepID=A0AAV3XPX0_9CYAN|nr:hypothetical protein [Microseira wollei]GET42911.1 hypothetical protein MiSe_77290 [Microseira wollei NIES-4236]
MKKTIKLMADYGCYPLWWVEDEKVGALSPSELPLSQETIKQLKAWASIYDDTLNQDYPPDSGLASEQEAEDFERQGVSLWQQLCQELAPDYEVFYFSEKLRQLLTDPNKILSLV